MKSLLLILLILSDPQTRPTQGLLWLLDHIPQISQFKSFVQLVIGDWESARKTQHNFVTGPLLAHLIPIAIDDLRTRTSGDPMNLQFQPGDVIFCRVNGPIYQVMLATSNETVVYAKPLTDRENATGSSMSAIIEENPWSNVIQEFTQGCFIDGVFCSTWSIFTRSSRACSFAPIEAVARARKDVSFYGRAGNTAYYDQYYCNCEHWVSLWYRGYPYSGQAYLAGKDGRTSLGCGIK